MPQLRPHDPAFELLHPRAAAGSAIAGEFVDVIGRLQALGAEWDAPNGNWLVPKERRAEFDSLLADVGFNSVEIPAGMRMATPEDVKRLAIPPAWTDVVVSDDPNAKRIAMGRDAKGRMQSIYSTAHAEKQAAEKFARIRLLENAMPEIDKRLDAESGSSDVAAAMLMIRELGLRPGGERDTRADVQAFGASTLQRRHVQVVGNTVRLTFVGKKGVKIDLEQDNPRLAKMLKPRLVGKSGNARLFDASQGDLRAWMQDAAPGFLPKDLRTRLATATASALVEQLPEPASPTDFKRQRNHVGDHVAGVLGNTRAMALGSYIDPSVFARWENADTMSSKEAKDRVSRMATVEDRLAAVEQWGLNDWPEQGELARKVLHGAADTQELHTVELSDGTRAYTTERAKLHDQIVGNAIHDPVAAVVGRDHPIAQKLARGEQLTNAERDEVRRRAMIVSPPRALFMAGGPASGKSSVLREDASIEPPNAVQVNADEMKEALPEYQRMIKGREKFAAAGAHEESSDLAKRLHAEAVELGLSVVLDGTGDSNPGKFAAKIRAVRESGYPVDVVYVTIPTDEAVVRSTLRALGSGRWVPIPELRKQHAGVSRNFDEVAALPGVNVRLFDNSGDKPKLIFEIRNGKRVILDQAAYDAFIAKQAERES